VCFPPQMNFHEFEMRERETGVTFVCLSLCQRKLMCRVASVSED